MADTEEPVFTSLAARRAALNQSQSKQHQTFGRRPPPPVPTSRPNLQARGQTTNNPPIATYGSSVTKTSNNLPNEAKTNLLPPPPVDRDRPASERKTSGPIRNVSPLPGRNDSQKPPALPKRRPQTNGQNGRRGSGSSTFSVSSTLSGLSLGQGSSGTSGSSIGEGRKMPPPLEHAKLPLLPPTRHEREQAEQAANLQRAPLVTTKSAPNCLRGPPPVDRDSMPKLPAKPALPTRPSVPSRTVAEKAEELQSTQPARRLPHIASATRSALTLGFNNKEKKDTSPPVPAFSTRPRREDILMYRPKGPAVQEVGEHDFDRVVMNGNPSLVCFYAPCCKYCKELDPIYQQLGHQFAFARNKLNIVKVDAHKHKSFMRRYDLQGYPSLRWFDGRNETPELYPYGWKLEPFTEWIEEKTGIDVADGATFSATGIPPPVNMKSKPGAAAVNAIFTNSVARLEASTTDSECLVCRDYSEADRVATQYPRKKLPRSGDMISYLADVLCSPFDSLTDKARAIFTWEHHNISYDVKSFFAGTVDYGASAVDVVHSGLAVCGGFAGLYSAIALKAGLECVMVVGHGKGYGYSQMKIGDPVPPRKPTGHAWNAVRIDGGEWKLVDPCWGAGHVTGKSYQPSLNPSMFTMSNDEFGIKHFPENDAYFFREDGGMQTWEDYIVGPVGVEGVELYNSLDKNGISHTNFSPTQKHIAVRSSEVTRIQFSRACEHYDHEIHGAGKSYLFVLHTHGLDGRKDDWIPFENNEYWYWLDIRTADLGAPGQDICVYTVNWVEDKDARGMTAREFLSKKFKIKMGPYDGICKWRLV
ncbi:hypothetical protein BJ878DRAFT_243326 [Calycina marina]|uniref:Thioredoxin domain-containing protein n=1 Tax=Calycina marina TaxID=1763456 RepID=A0A9P8CC39_9HELO|nr:hypothetical protein BJ878DRAFT_243326 [Calycina marina]